MGSGGFHITSHHILPFFRFCPEGMISTDRRIIGGRHNQGISLRRPRLVERWIS